MSENRRLPELEDLSEQIGEFIHYWGFKRVHGRIWTHLFLAARPLDAADLVRQMRISKALISISLRELLEYDVIQHAGRSDRGTHLYRTNADILSVILNVLRQRERRLISRVMAAQDALTRVDPAERAAFGLSDDRLVGLISLNERANAALEGLIALRSVDFGDWRKAFMASDDGEDFNDGSGDLASGASQLGGGRDLGDHAKSTTSRSANSNSLSASTHDDEEDSVVLPTGSAGSGVSFGGPR